jgi:hypothetical protein
MHLIVPSPSQLLDMYLLACQNLATSKSGAVGNFIILVQKGNDFRRHRLTRNSWIPFYQAVFDSHVFCKQCVYAIPSTSSFGLTPIR